MCHFWLDPKVTKRSRLTLTGYFETCARCRIPTRFAQTGTLLSLTSAASLYARPLRPEGEPSRLFGEGAALLRENRLQACRPKAPAMAVATAMITLRMVLQTDFFMIINN